MFTDESAEDEAAAELYGLDREHDGYVTSPAHSGARRRWRDGTAARTVSVMRPRGISRAEYPDAA